MYHYVRPKPVDLPYLRCLLLDDFCRQLDYFQQYGFVDREVFLESVATGRLPPSDRSGIVLTFDDSLSDHFEYVLPELRRRDLWGVFYIPTGVYSTGKLLDVHRTHLLLGRFGGKRILAALREEVSEALLSHAQVAEFQSLTYARQDNDEATTLTKRILNYFISYEHREAVLDRLMDRFFAPDDKVIEQFYMGLDQIATMQDQGMIIGSHSVTHPVFSKLTDDEQQSEIEQSFEFLDRVTGGLPVRNFAYPYGGFHTFTPATERMLAESGCCFSFNVETRDIEESDLAQRKQALPRYGCHHFPHGSAHVPTEP